MPVPILTVIIGRVATGFGSNPDTLLLLEPPAILLKPGTRLRLSTSENHSVSHQGWMFIERTRVVEFDEVEFVLRRIGNDTDAFQGERHLLIAKRTWTDEHQRCKDWWRRLAATLRVTRNGHAPIQRFPPPSPASSTLPASLRSTSEQEGSIAVDIESATNSRSETSEEIPSVTSSCAATGKASLETSTQCVDGV